MLSLSSVKAKLLVAVAIGVVATAGPSSPVWAGSGKKVAVAKKVKVSNNNVGSNNSVNVGSPLVCTISDPDASGAGASVSRGENSTTVSVNPPDNPPGAPSCS